MAVYNGDNGFYSKASYITQPSNGCVCDLLETPLASSTDANPTFISPELTTYPNVSYEVSYPSGTTGTLTVVGNNSGSATVGEQLSTAALSGTSAIAKFANYGYRYLILKFTTLSGTITDVIVVAKR